MLDHEYHLLLERLNDVRGESTEFFVFADTVAAKSFKGTNEAHGWMGVRFQAERNTPPSDIILHVRMRDKENILQQQALGIIGVNLVYGAFYYINDQDRFIRSLADNLTVDRIEVDMINFAGPLFANVDNRLMSLKLVEYGLTNAVMFGPNGEVLQPSEVLHKKAILVERGSFRPVTLVNEDMMRCALAQFLRNRAQRSRRSGLNGDHDAQSAVLREHRPQGLPGPGRHSRCDRKQCVNFKLFGVLQADFLFPPLY